MEHSDKHPKFPSGRKRGSVKCGLKSKVNIPKGAPVTKYPTKPTGTNELDKVFAALKSANSTQIDDESKHDITVKSKDSQLCYPDAKQEANKRIAGSVAKLLHTLESKSNFNTLPPKPTLQKPAVAPRKTKSIGLGSNSNDSIKLTKNEGTGKESTKDAVGKLLEISKNKPKPPSKPVPLSGKPSFAYKPSLPPHKPVNNLNNNVDKIKSTVSTLKEVPIKRLPMDKFAAFHSQKPTPHKRSIESSAINANKSYNKAPPPPARPSKLKSSTVYVDSPQCSITDDSETCSVDADYEVLPDQLTETEGKYL